MAQKAQLGFNFQPFNLPTPIDTTGAFSGMQDTLVKKYEEGELITEQAKEILGTMEVDANDQDIRNALAGEFDEDIGLMLEDYDGAFESKQFQRSAKQLIRKYVADPRIQAMKDTADEKKFEKQFMRESRAKGQTIWDFTPNAPTGTWQDDEGNWHSYKHGKELALDHLSDAKRHMDKLIANMSTGDPQVMGLSTAAGTVNMLKTSKYSGITDQRIRDRVDEVLDEFADSTQGGNQLARRVAMENGLGEIRNADGTLKKGVRDYLYNYLYQAGSNQKHSRVESNFQIPGALNPSGEGAKNNIWSQALTKRHVVNNPVAKDFKKVNKEAITSHINSRLRKARMAIVQSDPTLDTFSFGEMERNGLTDAFLQGLDPAIRNEYLVARRLSEQPVTNITEYVDIYRKSDGTFDKEAFNTTHRGMLGIMEDVYKEAGHEDVFKELMKPKGEGMIDPSAPLIAELDEKIQNRYNSFIDEHETMTPIGFPAGEDTHKTIERVYRGDDASAEFGALTGTLLFDKDGKQHTIHELAKKAGVDLNDGDEMRKFKSQVQLAGLNIPLVDKEAMEWTIQGETYWMQSDEIERQINAAGFEGARQVMLGETRVSEPTTINLGTLGDLTGTWEADYAFDDNDQYIGKGTFFRTTINGKPARLSIKQVARYFAASNGIYQ